MFHQPPPHGYPSAVPAYPPQFGQQVYQQPGFSQDFYGGRPPAYYERSGDARMHFPMQQPQYVPPILYPPQEVPVRISPVPDREHERGRESPARRRSIERRTSPKRKPRSRSPRRPEIQDRSSVRKSPPPRRSVDRKRSRSRSPIRSSRRSPARASDLKNSSASISHKKELNRSDRLSPGRRPSSSPVRRNAPLKRTGERRRSPVRDALPAVSTSKKDKYYDTKITIVNDRRRSRTGDIPWTGTWVELNSLLEHKRSRGKPTYEGSSLDIYKDLAELRRIIVEIRRRINGKPSSGPIRRDLVAEDFSMIRRAGEGLKPLFDRPELALNEERSVVVKEATPEKTVVNKREKDRDLARREARSSPRRRSTDRRAERGAPLEERSIVRTDRARPDERNVVRSDRGRPDEHPKDRILRHDDERLRIDDRSQHRLEMHDDVHVRREEVRVRREDDRRPDERPEVRIERRDDRYDNVRDDRQSESDLRYQLERRRHSDSRPEMIHERTLDQPIFPDRFRPESYEPFPQPIFHAQPSDFHHQFDHGAQERTIYNQPLRDRRIPASERIGAPVDSRMRNRSPQPVVTIALKQPPQKKTFQQSGQIRTRKQPGRGKGRISRGGGRGGKGSGWK